MQNTNQINKNSKYNIFKSCCEYKKKQLKNHDAFFYVTGLQIILTFCINIFPATSESRYSIYAITVETVTINGSTSFSGFSMTPADKEYRIDGFYRIITKGSAKTDSKSPFEYAVNDALSKLAVEKGLKSVRSSQMLYNGILTDVTTMRHDGLIRYPYTSKNIMTEDKEKITVEVEVEFSPYSFPDNWDRQKFKKSISNCLSDMVSVFRQLWNQQ